MSKAKPFAIASIVAAGILTFAGCSSGTTTASASGTGTAPSGTCTTPTPVSVDVMSISDVSPIYLGRDRGFFKDQCIDLKLNIAATGDLIIPSVMSGDDQFGFSNIITLALAKQKNLPVKMIAPAASTTSPGNDVIGLVVAPDSTIKSPADFAGKTVAVSGFNNISEVLEKAVVAKAGGDPNSLKFVQLGLPDMLSAVTSHQVDVGFMVEPFLTMAKEAGLKVVSMPMSDLSDNFLTAGYFTSESLAAKDPDLVKRFTTAITESLAYADAHPDQARGTFHEYTSIPDAVGQKLTLPHWPSTLDTNSLQQVLDLSSKWGALSGPLDASQLLQ